MTPPPAADEDSLRAPAAAPPESARAAIVLAGVTAGWRGQPPVLNDIDLRLTPGGTAIVHGGPGAGKSALLHVLRGALLPRAGRALLLGSDVATLPAQVRRALKQRIGYIAQTPLLDADDTTFDAVAAPLRLTAPTLNARMAGDVVDLLAYLGLSDVAGQPVAALTGTQQRLVGVARAFIAQPDIVLADEPLAGLGPDGVARVLRLLSEIARQRAAVAIATQTPELFAALPAARLRLDRGRLSEAPA